MATGHEIRDGLDSLESNMGDGKKSLRCKWVFQYKYVFELEKPKYKARLIAKGFKQEHGVDYDEILVSNQEDHPPTSTWGHGD